MASGRDLPPAGPGAAETAEEYLERHGIRAYVQDVCSHLMELRPDSPVRFVADYFANVESGDAVLFRRFKYVTATLGNARSFVRKLREAYGDVGGERVTGDAFHQMLAALCPDFPRAIVRNAARLAHGSFAASPAAADGDGGDGAAVPGPAGGAAVAEMVLGVSALVLYGEFLSRAAVAFRHAGGSAGCPAPAASFARALAASAADGGGGESARGCATLQPSEAEVAEAVREAEGSGAGGGLEFAEFCSCLFRQPGVARELTGRP